MNAQTESRVLVWLRVAEREEALAEEAEKLFIHSAEPMFWSCVVDCLRLATRAREIARYMQQEEEKLALALAFAELSEREKAAGEDVCECASCRELREDTI
jgi:hypothetical protein